MRHEFYEVSAPGAASKYRLTWLNGPVTEVSAPGAASKYQLTWLNGLVDDRCATPDRRSRWPSADSRGCVDLPIPHDGSGDRVELPA